MRICSRKSLILLRTLFLWLFSKFSGLLTYCFRWLDKMVCLLIKYGVGYEVWPSEGKSTEWIISFFSVYENFSYRCLFRSLPLSLRQPRTHLFDSLFLTICFVVPANPSRFVVHSQRGVQKIFDTSFFYVVLVFFCSPVVVVVVDFFSIFLSEEKQIAELWNNFRTDFN